MPRKAHVDDAPVKRERLTLQKLASYDDILTDVLVDHVYFWTTIRKNRNKYNLTRGISEDEVTKIILHDLIVNKNPQNAEKNLLMLPGLRKFVEKLNTKREKEDFIRHFRKYLNIWSTDCPWEVSTTNRYTILTHEASVTARRPIKKGETIKYLCGNLVAMTEEEEKDLDFTRRDFSIVMSSRKRTPSLFLGPARFSNHDCDANAKLATTGATSMQVVAIKNIEHGEEITVTYGEGYFGEDNCECLCGTCESMARNGWTPKPEALLNLPTVESIEIENMGVYTLRSKRKFGSDISSKSATPELEGRPSKRLKSTNASMTMKNSPLRNAIKDVTAFADVSPPAGKGTRPEKSLVSRLATSISPSDRPLDKNVFDGAPRDGDFAVEDWSSSIKKAFKYDKKRPTSFTDDGDETLTIIAATEIGDTESATEVLQTTRPIQHIKAIARTSSALLEVFDSVTSDADSIFDKGYRRDSTSTPITRETGSPSEEDAKSNTRSTQMAQEDLDHLDILQSGVEKGEEEDQLVSSEARDEEVPQQTSTEMIEEDVPRQKRKYRKHVFVPEPVVVRNILRYPKDYTLVEVLLTEPTSRWVECKTCDQVWVQPNGYYTRKECPRCERHSKLFGYQWPQTDPQKGDKAGRIMDHRTVHRFLGAEEEKASRRLRVGRLGFKGLDGMPRSISIDTAPESPAKRELKKRGAKEHTNYRLKKITKRVTKIKVQPKKITRRVTKNSRKAKVIVEAKKVMKVYKKVVKPATAGSMRTSMRRRRPTVR